MATYCIGNPRRFTVWHVVGPYDFGNRTVAIPFGRSDDGVRWTEVADELWPALVQACRGILVKDGQPIYLGLARASYEPKLPYRCAECGHEADTQEMSEQQFLIGNGFTSVNELRMWKAWKRLGLELCNLNEAPVQLLGED